MLLQCGADTCADVRSRVCLTASLRVWPYLNAHEVDVQVLGPGGPGYFGGEFAPQQHNDSSTHMQQVGEEGTPEEPMSAPTVTRRSLFIMKPSAHSA